MLLPSSTNDKPEFGKIHKLLVSDQGKDAYLYYQKCSNHYCHDTDLFIVNDCEQFGIISTIKLPDYHPIEVERLISQAKKLLVFHSKLLSDMRTVVPFFVSNLGIIYFFKLCPIFVISLFLKPIYFK